MFCFKIIKKDKEEKARLGILKTPHGIIHTPAFSPVATKGALRGINFEKTKSLGIEVLMINTFHLYINDRYKIVKKFGGLHKFLNFNLPLMTDSGGFQVFSLGFALEHGVGKIATIFPERKLFKKKREKSLIKIFNEGVEFNSPINGKKIFLSPEKSIKVQKILGADIVFTFDECTSPLSSYEYTKKALLRTHLWAERCLKEFSKTKTNQSLFGIVQGGEYKDLREESAKFISSLPFFGFGIGGSLGKSKKDMLNVLSWTIPLLPEEKPKHLLGIGEIEDLFGAIEKGVDLFDCVIPTRLARHNTAITSGGKIVVKNSKYLKDKSPLDKNCPCNVCKKYSRAYLCHLTKEKEINGILLLAEHNLFWILNLMKKIRESIKEGYFKKLKRNVLRKLKKESLK